MPTISSVTLVVPDYDEAIAFYTEALGFTLIEDVQLSETKRWVRVAPPGAKETALLLAQAVKEEEKQAIGYQSGGRVFLFLQTDDFERDYAAFQKAGVTFLEEPRYEAYGTVAVFQDLFGNQWDLIENK